MWRAGQPSEIRGGRLSPPLLLALVLAVLLTAWWTAQSWSDLGVLRLPEADDMLRLAQIRDWLDGHAFSDLAQARLGPPGGTEMHWSRLPDLVPALLVRLISPFMGATRAEIAAVIFWPELLFFFHLLLAGALARRLGGAATAAPAVALAALAFPALALFLPGRIDHHGLQIVLVETMMLGLVGRRLLLAGGAAGASLLVGIEAAPIVIVGMVWLGATWVRDRRQVAGFGLGLVAVTLAGLVMVRPEYWPADRCDGFTPSVFALMLIAGGAWLIVAGLSPRLPDHRWRIATAAAMTAFALAAGWAAAPACFASPYGPADAMLGRIWPEQPGEYGGFLRQSPGMLIAFLGLPLMGLGASVWFGLRAVDRRSLWVLFALVMAASLIGAFIQLRSAWFAAALAAPVLAQLVDAMRGRGALWQIAVWLLSAGLVWQALGSLADAARPKVAGCADRGTLSALNRLDTGTFAAPMDLSAYLIGGTQHRSLGGPYHRNIQGNRALAEFFLSSPEEARYQASLWAVDYVALCPTPTGGLPRGLLRRGGLAESLLNGAAPDWLEPVSLIGSDTLVWRVRGIAGPRLQP